MRIGVLSRNPKLYSTSRLVEACEKRGHEADIIDTLRCNLVMDASGPGITYQGENLEDKYDAVIPRIGASITFYGSAVIRQFEMCNVFTTVDSQSLIRSRDKLRSLQLLSRSGVGIPKTVFTNYTKNAGGIVDMVGGAPVIIKLLEGTQGLGVVLAENKKAATSVIEAFHGLKARVIIQEFIKEAGGADIRALIVGRKVVGAMKRQAADGEFRSNLHRGGSSSIVKLTKEEKDAAVQAARTMGLHVAGVDLLRSERGPLILEVNSSPGLEGIEEATNIDIASKIIEFIERKNRAKTQSQNPV